MATNRRKPEDDSTLQMLLESRIKRHGLINSWYRGCRCERCVNAVSVANKKCYESYKEAIKRNASLRGKYMVECKNWVEEFFPEVAEQIKNSLIDRENDGL